MTKRFLVILLLAGVCVTAGGLAGPLGAALPQHPGSPGDWLRVLASEAAAQPAPDDDDDDDEDDAEDDDPGGDAVGDDDVGNVGAGGPGAPPDDPAAPDDDDDDAGDDGPTPPPAGGTGPVDDDDPDDDDAPAAGGPVAGPPAQGNDDDDDGPAPPYGGPAPGGAEPPPDGGSEAPAPARREPRRTVSDGPPGGAGMRGVSPDGEARLRDGDGDRSRPADLPANVDLDDRGQWVRAGEVLALTTNARALARARALGFREVERIPLPALGLVAVRLRAPTGRALPSAVAALRAADPDNAYDFNHLYRQSQARPAPRSRPAPPRRTGRSRAAPAASAPAPARATVAMIDGPVAQTHPAFVSAQIVQRSFAGPGPARNAAHGTAVASLLVGRDAGRLQAGLGGGRLLAADVVSGQAAGFDLGAAAAIVQALDWIVAQGGPVVNISLAGPPNALLEEAVRRTVAKGVIVVAAVGNDGPAAPPRYPAAYADVLGVTAVDGSGAVYRRAGRGAHVDLAAIGVNVTVAAAPRSYAAQTGTSFAAPVVAADLARQHRRPDSASAARALAVAAADARDAGAPGRDPVYGAGIVAAPAAAASASPAGRR